MLDVPLKLISLLWTQFSAACGIALALPSILWRLATGTAHAAQSDCGGAVFYEGVVKHVRRSPVTNAFE